jgi:hypothetical protein
LKVDFSGFFFNAPKHHAAKNYREKSDDQSARRAVHPIPAGVSAGS